MYVIHVFVLEGKDIFVKIEQSMLIKITVSYKEVYIFLKCVTYAFLS